MPRVPQRAALLVRISEDREQTEAGVSRQEQDARALAERLGWRVVEVFVENDTSAYKRRQVTLPDGSTALRVVRPEFRRLLDAVSVGAVDGLIAYHLDRVARDPRDLEDLIDVVEQTRIPVESVTGSLRLATDTDITVARIGVAIANQSSRDASRRIKRKHDQLAEQGAFGGGGARRYGYERDGVTVREDEAAVIRYAARRMLAGSSVAGLARELDEQGHRPVKADRWSSRSLADVLKSARIAGMRVHRGKVVGEAAWPAILPRETWDELQVVMAGRSAGAVRRDLRYWLSGLLVCGLCGYRLEGQFAGEGRHRYWCAKTRRSDGCGGIAIQGNAADAEITRQVLAYLTQPGVRAAIGTAVSTDGAARARTDLADDVEQLRELSRMWAEKAITLAEYAEARKVIQARIDGAQAAQIARVPLATRTVLLAPDPAAAWEALTPTSRRDAARTLIEALGYVGWEVAPHDRRKARRFDPERLTLLPKGAPLLRSQRDAEVPPRLSAMVADNGD